MKTPLLIVPGWQDSGPGHWQTLWQKKLGATRVAQREWMNPKRTDWVRALDSAVRSLAAPPILIAHSLGCITTAILSAESDCAIAGAFLVAPTDLELESTPKEIAVFLPMPLQKLRFPSILVASSNDHYCSAARAQKLADAWGSRHVNLGPSGHINSDSGFGPWDEGRELLESFTRQI